MSSQDAELDRFRNGVSCAALLENMVPGWRLDAKESTGRALKYRRGEGEILIVNRDGRGWWDPQSQANHLLQANRKSGRCRKAMRRSTS